MPTTAKQNNALTANDIASMLQYRKAEIECKAPDLNKEDFASDSEYRKALMENYKTLRQEEYELTVRNECTKVYNLTKDGRAAGINENSGIWNGYKSYINAPKISADEKQRRKEQIEDCAISRSQDICKRSVGAPLANANSCAIAATSIQAQVSDKMGYTDKENLINIEKTRNGLVNNAVAAQGVAKIDSIPQTCRYQPEIIKKQPQKKSLNDLVKSGELGVGDSASLHTGAASNTSTGYHAVTIADVHKDDKGNVTSYTLHSANGTHLKTINVNDKNNYYGSKPVYNAVKTHEFMATKINEETKSLENLSTEELEAKVKETKDRTCNLVNDLEKTETYNRQKGYSSEMAAGYKADIKQKAALYAEYTGGGITDNAPQAREELKTEIKNQTATLPSDTKTEIKSDRFNAVVDHKNNVANLDKQTEGTTKEAMKKDAKDKGIEVNTQTSGGTYKQKSQDAPAKTEEKTTAAQEPMKTMPASSFYKKETTTTKPAEQKSIPLSVLMQQRSR